MGTAPRRSNYVHRQDIEQRDFYSRTPDNNLRINAPDGYLIDFAPVPWDDPQAAGAPGGWWVGSDTDRYQAPWGMPMAPGTYGPVGPSGTPYGPAYGTTGSKLTNPDPRFPHASPGAWLPAVTRCLSIIVNSVVRTRWVYRNSDGQVIPRPLWIDDPMLLGKAPGPIQPVAPIGDRLGAHQFWSTILADAILWGQGGFVFQESPDDGHPIPGTLQLLNPFGFRTRPDGHLELGTLTDDPFSTDRDGRFIMGGQVMRAAVMQGQYPNHDGWPQGVMLRHWHTFRTGASLGRYIDNQFFTGVPSGYLSVSTPNFGDRMVTDPDNPRRQVPEQELLKRRWMAAHGRGRRSVAVLNSTVSYTPIALNPVDTDAVKMASVNRTDVAHAFGMSSVWLDEGMGGLNYSNSSERRADLVTMTTAAWGEMLTDFISSLMPYGTTASVLWSMFINGSLETQTPQLVQLVQAGIYTAHEARQQLSVEPWTGVDPQFVDTSKAAGGQEGDVS